MSAFHGPSGHGNNSHLSRAMGPVARAILGAENKALSSRTELRWGERGSMSVDLDTGTWCEHGTENNGGLLDFLRIKKRLDKPEALEWLQDGGFIPRSNGHANGHDSGAKRIVAEYDYYDADGALVFQVVRFEPKDFRQRVPAPGGKWTWKTKGTKKFLYHLPQLIEAVAAGRTIYVVEGEKAVAEVEKLGLPATCSPGGALKWRPDYGTPLTGGDVVILTDNDDPGRAHASDVAGKLTGIAKSIRLLALPDLAEKGDVYDWVQSGGTKEALEALVAETPLYEHKPEAAAAKAREAKPEDPDEVISEGSAAEAFAKEHGDKLRYCHTTGAWFAWDGVSWKRERTKLAYRYAHQKAKQLAADTESTRAIINAGKSSFAAGVERIAQSDRVFAVTGEIWDADPWLLGTPGGTVDLRTGILRPARQEDYITKITAVAPAETADCPIWRRFRDEATRGDAGYKRFLLQWEGYCLTGVTTEHALLFAHGNGGNGKSVWLNTISSILGDYARTASMDTFTASKSDKHPTDIAGLAGARFVCASETEEGRNWSEVRITQLTGGDKVSARFMRQDFFEFTPQFKLTIIGNHQPTLNNVNDAARRRFNMAPFTNKPEHPDHQLMEKLKAEYAGILRAMIDGCLDWQENGLLRPSIVTSSTDEYFSEQDLFGQWLDDCCVRVDQDGIPTKDTCANLMTSWSAFAKARGEDPGSSRAFGGKMRSRGFRPLDNKLGIKGKGYQGIAVRTMEYPD
jgi:putative DNA primase/helicase